jgi:hypothetical protein
MLLQRTTRHWRRFPKPTSGTPERNVEYRSWAVAAEVRTSVYEDGLALLHIPTGRMFLCNRTGSRIWQGIVKGLSTDAIADEISHECGVAIAVVQQHTSSFVSELERRGLVTRRIGD